MRHAGASAAFWLIERTALVLGIDRRGWRRGEGVEASDLYRHPLSEQANSRITEAPDSNRHSPTESLRKFGFSGERRGNFPQLRLMYLERGRCNSDALESVSLKHKAAHSRETSLRR